MKTRTAVFTLIPLLVCALQAQAVTRFVPQQYDTIQAAIDDSNDHDTVIVAPGAYSGPGNRDIDFKGKAITLRSENGPENCIIDCQGSPADPNTKSKKHFPPELRAKTMAVALSLMLAEPGRTTACTKSLWTCGPQRNHTFIQFFERVET